jgi:hypothetical protein
MKTSIARASLTGIAGLAVAAGAVTACGSSPAPSAACQKATQGQDSYAMYAVSQGYPDMVSVQQAMTFQAADITLLQQMKQAGCPQNTRFYDMSAGQYNS